MKKIYIAILLAFILVITGCSQKSSNTNQEVKPQIVQKTSENIQIVKENLEDFKEQYHIVNKGDFYLFSCVTSDVYITFLNSLDQTKYEIIDIQMQHYTDGNYWVTYKKK